MDNLKKARKAFTNAYIQSQGHINWEFQYSKNRDKSTKVAERNTAEVRRTAATLTEVCDKRMAELKEEISKMEMIKYHLREMQYYPKITAYGIETVFPEILEGVDQYGNRYLDRKYSRRK